MRSARDGPPCRHRARCSLRFPGPEGLPSEETVRAYETIYFPAQRVLFERDEPRDTAAFVLAKDARQLQPA